MAWVTYSHSLSLFKCMYIWYVDLKKRWNQGNPLRSHGSFNNWAVIGLFQTKAKIVDETIVTTINTHKKKIIIHINVEQINLRFRNVIHGRLFVGRADPIGSSPGFWSLAYKTRMRRWDQFPQAIQPWTPVLTVRPVFISHLGLGEQPWLDNTCWIYK